MWLGQLFTESEFWLDLTFRIVTRLGPKHELIPKTKSCKTKDQL